MGITVLGANSRYVYDPAAGYGKIYEDVTINEVMVNSIAEGFGLSGGDIIKSLIINGKEYAISRTFTVSDLILTMRAGDNLSVKYLREGTEKTTENYVLQTRDFKAL